MTLVQGPLLRGLDLAIFNEFHVLEVDFGVSDKFDANLLEIVKTDVCQNFTICRGPCPSPNASKTFTVSMLRSSPEGATFDEKTPFLQISAPVYEKLGEVGPRYPYPVTYFGGPLRLQQKYSVRP